MGIDFLHFLKISVNLLCGFNHGLVNFLIVFGWHLWWLKKSQLIKLYTFYCPIPYITICVWFYGAFGLANLVWFIYKF